MALVRWDPFRGVTELQDRINRIFDETFTRSRDLDEEMTACAWTPVVDIYEVPNGIVLVAELPGVAKGDVSVEVKDNILTLKGDRKAEVSLADSDYYRRERCFGPFKRSFTLVDRIEPNLIKATFKDGILKVEIPRLEEEKPKQVKVSVE